MRRYVALVLLAALLAGSSGRQMEEELLVIVLAADQTEEGGCRLTVKAPASAGQQDGDKAYLALEASGGSFAEAMMLLHASTPRKLNFSQVREIMISSAAAESPSLFPLLAQIEALPRMRGTAAVVVCLGSACDAAQRIKPYMGLRLSRYTEDSLADAASKGFTPSTTLAQALREAGSHLMDPLLILGAVNPRAGEEKGGNDAGGGPDAGGSPGLQVQAGGLHRSSADPIDLFGAAATDGERVTGYLTGDEMALLHLLTGSGHFYAQNLNAQPVTLHARGPAQLQVDLEPRPIRLSIRLLCDVRLSPATDIDVDALRRQTERAALALIRHLQQLQCDALGFGEKAVRQMCLLRDWEALRFPALYREAAVDVSFSLRLRAD